MTLLTTSTMHAALVRASSRAVRAHGGTSAVVTPAVVSAASVHGPSGVAVPWASPVTVSSSLAARFHATPSWSNAADGATVAEREAADAVARRSGEGASTSFIDTAKVKGANALLGKFLNNGKRFDSAFAGMKVTEVSAGRAVCEVDVTDGLQNAYKTLHGGAITTLVDIVGTLALLSLDPTRAGVSVELNVSFASAAKAGETVVVEGRVLKAGKKLGFTEVDVRRASDGALIATGRHTKAL